MAVPKRKTSKLKKRQRKASKRLKDIQLNLDPKSNTFRKPHRICPETGVYNSKQIIASENYETSN